MSRLTDEMALQIKAAKLPEPKREVMFHKTRKWRFDFSWWDFAVALEVEGGQWIKGRHQRPDGFENDAIKYSEAALLGWTVIRATTNMVKDGRALALLERALK